MITRTGSPPYTRVPRPADAVDAQAAVEGFDPITQPTEPGADGVGASDPVVGDRDCQVAVGALTSMVARVACACFATLASASAATK